MIILGVWDGTPSSAALIVNGEIKLAVSEERLSRSKNAYGYPRNSIECILKKTGYKISDIDEFAMSTASLSPTTYLKKCKICKDYWKNKMSIGTKNFMRARIQNTKYLKKKLIM